MGWWRGVLATHAPVVEQQVRGTVARMKKAKFGMPVDVKVRGDLALAMPASMAFVVICLMKQRHA